MADQNQSPNAPPSVLPANFSGWDAQPPKQSGPPATLPANFTGWDAAPKQEAKAAPKATPPATLPADHTDWDKLKPWEMHPQTPQASMRAWSPSLFERAKIAFRASETGRNLSANWDQFKQMANDAIWGNEEDAKDLHNRITNFVDQNTGAGLKALGLPTGGALEKTTKGAAKFGMEFPAEMADSPGKVALLGATFGETALSRAAMAAGLPKLVPAAKVLSKLIQAQFISQMAEGAYAGARDSIKSAINGDWEGAVENGLNGLANGLMARAGISHAEATERVMADLNAKAVETQGAKFDKLSPEKQGEVIDAAVQSSPEYQAVIADVDAKSAQAEKEIREGRVRKLAEYEGHAYEQAWNLEASKRAVDMIRGKRAEEARARVERSVIDAHKQNIIDAIKKRDDEIRDLQEKRRAGIKAGRIEKGKEKAEERAPILQTAGQIAEGREQTAKERDNIQVQPSPEEMWRPVESHVDENGHVSYPANYIDQKARIGVVTDGNQHSIYRMAGDRVEWLDQSGIFVPEPTDLYQTDNAEVADTLARIGAASTTADTLAEQENANEDNIRDSNELDEVRKSLVTGDITPDEARRKAGIAEMPEIRDEYRAARAGQLGGPFAEDSPARFASKFENDLRESGASEEEIQATMESLPEITRAQTEQNLHHVQKSGDYILSKKRVRWTLDSKGILHPEDGGVAIPLMKRGLYSSQAMRLASSGKVGYGAESFENAGERRRWEKAGEDALGKADAILAAPYGFGESPEDEREARRSAYERRTKGKGIQPPPKAGETEPELRHGTYTQEPQFANLLLALENAPHADVTKYMRDPDRTMAAFVKAAEQAGVKPEALVRMKLMQSPDTTVATIAGLNPGDTIKPKGGAEGAWTVVTESGGLKLQYGNISVPLDRINPSETVKRIISRGNVETRMAPAQASEVHPPAYVDDRKQAVEEVNARAQGEIADPPPQTKKQAEAQEIAAEQRKDAAIGDAIAKTVAVTTVTAQTTEAEINEKAKAAEEARKTAQDATAQLAAKQAKAEATGKFEQRAPIQVARTGNETTISQGNETFKAHYALVNPANVTTSHRWEGNHPAINPAYTPEGMQKRIFDETNTPQLLMEARIPTEGDGGVHFRLEDWLADYNGPERGPTVLEPGGRAVGGNTRLLRLLKYLENVKRAGGEQGEVLNAIFRDQMRQFANKVGIRDYPDDGEPYIVVRILDKPFETNEEAIRVGDLFNSRTSADINRGVEAITHGRYLNEADARERADGQKGVLAEIANALAGEEISTVRGAIDEHPQWFAAIARKYFHIPSSEERSWFEKGVSGDMVLSGDGKDKFELALLSTHIPNAEAAAKIQGTGAGAALVKAIGTITALRAYPDRDLTEKISGAVDALMKTEPYRKYKNGVPGDKPGVAWAKAYGINTLAGIMDAPPPEPDIIVRAIYQTMLDQKTTRLKNALKDLIGGQQPGMGLLITPTGEAGNSLVTPADFFNEAFKPELKEIGKQEQKEPPQLTQAEFEDLLKNKHVEPMERPEEPKVETQPEEKPTPKFGPPPRGAVEPAPFQTPDGRWHVIDERNGKFINTAKDEADATAKADQIKAVQKKYHDAFLKGTKEGIAPPPKAKAPEEKLAAEKAEQGYVTPDQLKDFLQKNPATKDHAPELYRTAQLMAEYVYDADPPEGVNRKDALDWILRERVAGIEAGGLKSARGEYSDPNIEKDLGTKILKLHKAADATTFIHEFAHVIFPFLSQDDLKAIDSIGQRKVWDGGPLKGETYAQLSEKLAHGMERFLRDQNPRDFKDNVAAVLAKVKGIFRKVYLSFKKDPLAPYTLGSDSVELFDKMFHIEGSDVPDTWREEVKKARAAEKKIAHPEEAVHPEIKVARSLGATGITDAVDGKVVDSIGDRVDPKKPVAVLLFNSLDDAQAAIARWSDKNSPFPGAELIEREDGSGAVRVNTKSKLTKTILRQGLPERKRTAVMPDKTFRQMGDLERKLDEAVGQVRGPDGSFVEPDSLIEDEIWELAGGEDKLFQELPPRHDGLQLEDLEKRLAETPSFQLAKRKLLELQIQNLKNKIRADHGAEESNPQPIGEAAKQAVEEAKNGAQTNGRRKADDGVSGLPQPPATGGIPKPPNAGRTERAGTGRGPGGVGGRVSEAPVSLENVKPVTLEPMAKERGTPVGLTKFSTFTQKAWVDRLQKGGLPETLPPPTWALDPKTAAQLIYPGQKEIVQTALSALRQGDGVAIVSPPGTGKCLGKGTPVMMYDGTIQKVEDIRVGDLLMGPDSEPRTVLSLAHGRDMMYRVTPVKGMAYEVNEPHILSLKISPTGKKYDRPGIVNIPVCEYLNKSNTFKHHAKGYRVGVSFPYWRVPMDPYILGLWLGDGTSSRPEITTEDPEVRAFWTDYVEGRGGWIRKDQCGERCAAYIAVFYKKGTTPATNLVWNELLELGVVENKHIPHIYKANSERVRLELLAGLIDTDGSPSTGTYDFISKSSTLAEDVAYVARSLGFAAYITPCKKTCTNNGKSGTYYRVCISGDVSRIPVRIDRKKVAKRLQKKDVLVTGIKVEAIGRGEYFGFEIDGDHLFLLGDFTVTHNTYTSSAIAKEFLLQKPDANILYISKNRNLYNKFRKVAAKTFGIDVSDDPLKANSPNGVYVTSYAGTLNDDIFKNKKWDLVLADEAGEARRFYDPNTQQGEMLRKIMANADKGVYLSATPFHSPSEYGYLDKLNMWPKGRYGRWLAENFKHRMVNGEVVAELDPAKQAKLREQLIARGQLIPQNISYEGYTAHFGVVPVTHDMERGLNRIRVGFDRARQMFDGMGKKGLARKVAAFEAVYTKNFLERSRLPQAIELAKRAMDQGWRVLVFSEHTSDDLFRRERQEGEDASTYQQLDDAMGGGLSKIIPPYAGVYGELEKAFPGTVGDYSGRGNTDAAREKARIDFLKGDLRMLYASYAGGGIGVDMHDADFPDLGIKGGDKPIVAIYLGPPYSGVLLEQAMGRPWRFGVKSNVHAVFLATDAEPEIRLMQTKIGPRMKALRAAVVGEKDSLADVMASYTDDQKVRERQEQLAYAQGNEVKLNATDLVARKGRHVGIQSWDHIQFPSAEDAKFKGMKYGDEVTGGDWSTLYQDAQNLWKQGPPTTEKIEGDKAIDAIASSVMNGEVPVQNLDPAEKTAEVGAASAMAADAVALGGDRDPQSVVKNTMKWGLKIPKQMDVRFEKSSSGTGPLKKTVERAVWTFPEGVEPHNVPVGDREEEIEDRPTSYKGWGSMKGGIESIARQAGTPEIGLNLTRMIGSWQRDVDMMQSQFRWYARENFEKNGLDWKKQSVVAEVMAVAERTKTSADPAINKAAEAMRDWFGDAAEYAVKEGVKKQNAEGKWVPFKPLENYWTHIIDWKAELEYKDPKTGEMKRTSLRDAMKHTFPEDARNALMQKLASAAKWSDGQPVSVGDLDRYLRRNYRKGTPLQPNVQTERTINFPIVRKDFDVLNNYAGQIARAISTERYFGSDRGKLLTEISKIPSTNGRRDITLMFDSMLSPQELSKRWLAFSNAMTAFTALSKMSLSFAKVPFHSTHMIYALHGDVRPMVKATVDAILHYPQAREDAIFMGTLARQVDFTGVTDTGQKKGPSHLMFEVTGFNFAYDIGRVWTSLAAKHWMEDYALRGLKKGGQSAEEVRRMLKNTMLIGDDAVNRAMQTGSFTPQDIQRAQVAFANEVMFTDNPMEMPAWARIHIGRETPGYIANLSRAMRLTYSMASFTVKTRALLRKHIVDEVFRYHNPKMLALFAAIEPIIGASVWSAGAGIKSLVQRGAENVSGQQHKKNALDKEIAEFEAAIYGKNGPKKLAQDVELYIDMLTAGIAQEQIKLLGDMLLNIAANPKRAMQGAEFFGGDLFEHIIGPIWTSTIVHPLGWVKREVEILAGSKGHKGKRTVQNTEKTILKEFPVTSNIPQLQGITKPPR